MSSLRIATFAAVLTAGSTALAADGETAKPPKDFAPLLGASIAGAATGDHLGPGFSFGVDAGFRKRFGAWAVVASVRPFYERFGLGKSEDKNCLGQTATVCANNSVYRSNNTAHALGAEIPLKLEYHTEHDWIPFIGVAPGFMWFNATEKSQGLVPRTEAIEETASKTFLTLNTFLGLGVPIGEHGSFTLRGGYRFAPTVVVPGGAESVRGVVGSIGYLHAF